MNTVLEDSGDGPRGGAAKSKGRYVERRIDSQHPALVHCVVYDREDERYVTWCGVGTPYEPYFMSKDHALEAKQKNSRPVPCEFCMTKILEDQ